MPELKLTLLGTGCAGGMPVYGCHCQACVRSRQQTDKQRKQCTALIEAGETRLLLDAGLHDLPARFPPGSLSAILLTHYHVDHVQGLFHWRWGRADKLAVYGPKDSEGCADLLKHPGFFDFNQTLSPFQTITWGDDSNKLSVTPLPLTHSKPVFGYCIENRAGTIAYLTDTIGLPEETRRWLKTKKIDSLILDCTHSPAIKHPRNHNNLDMAIAIHNDLQPDNTILTHISDELDCWLMDNEQGLPNGISVGFDTLKINLK